MNPRNAGRKKKLNATDDDRKYQREQSKEFKKQNENFSEISETPPTYLDGVAKAAWRTIVPELKGNGLLRNIDRYELELFVKNYSAYRSAEKALQKFGAVYENDKGNLQKNPAMNVLDTTTKSMKSLASDLGLNFNSRAEMLSNRKPDDDEVDVGKQLQDLLG
ncbi:hypothetical protein IV38_GL001953 [Lactobacillus selangorensis]|uniref:Uncharacterized protein n=1 Tax=Lactobacillus selangorensis TaxID=81857 RepID=A0A0R2FJ76_9LACO|nr:phage terminase small subunit P27 family [Lactobacillus selangorensis]KRN27739.1 hypothetical protein IV38_GL001953 [Lactobacillus selangorensis]KRN30296.1 hypothetical protein IV40_GL001884 [Lactobacillus selangorensis]